MFRCGCGVRSRAYAQIAMQSEIGVVQVRLKSSVFSLKSIHFFASLLLKSGVFLIGFCQCNFELANSGISSVQLMAKSVVFLVCFCQGRQCVFGGIPRVLSFVLGRSRAAIQNDTADDSAHEETEKVSEKRHARCVDVECIEYRPDDGNDQRNGRKTDEEYFPPIFLQVGGYVDNLFADFLLFHNVFPLWFFIEFLGMPNLHSYIH